MQWRQERSELGTLGDEVGRHLASMYEGGNEGNYKGTKVQKLKVETPLLSDFNIDDARRELWLRIRTHRWRGL